MDWLASIFLGAFVFVLIFCLASLLFGFNHLSLDGHGSHFHLGDAIDPAGHDLPGVFPAHPSDFTHTTGPHSPAGSAPPSTDGHVGTAPSAHQMSPWNLTALLAFVTWFGGAGYLVLTVGQFGLLLALLASVTAGAIGWSIIYLFLSRVLLKAQSQTDPAEYRLEGTVARVTSPIGAGRIGEIVYTKGASRHSDGARSVDGVAIDRGTEVVVVRYERGIAYVEPWGSFVDGEARPAR